MRCTAVFMITTAHSEAYLLHISEFNEQYDGEKRLPISIVIEALIILAGKSVRRLRSSYWTRLTV